METGLYEEGESLESEFEELKGSEGESLYSMLGWIKKQKKRGHSKTGLWKKAATLQEKIEEMCWDYLMWKQIRRTIR